MQPKESFKLSRVLIALFFAILIVIPTALAFRYKDILTIVISEKSDIETLIADAITPITNRKIYVHCTTFNLSTNGISTHGETPFIGDKPLPIIELSKATCDNIDDFSNSKAKVPADNEQLQALITIAHEAFHTTGTIDEAETDCYALQRIDSVAEKLGANKSEAASIQQRAVRLQRNTAATGYNSSECRDGGAFDLDPNSPGALRR